MNYPNQTTISTTKKEAILPRVAAGDKQAVEDCLNQYGGLVWSLAKRYSPSQEDAEDAVQEIFLDVWRYAARYDAKQAAETTFIATIARRRLIDRLRKQSRQVQTYSFDDNPREFGSRQDYVLQTKVEANQARQAMKKLRPEQQNVLQLAIFQGLSHQEISRATGMPLGTVKTHVRRGLNQIRQFLGLTSSNQTNSMLMC
jgi:RNA polymerase sigma-70 factor (ECF subfamily)